MTGAIPEGMSAMVLTGHGGLDKLEYRDDVATPRPAPGEVLIKVGAAGLNNTDVNTRTGWYSKTVTDGTTAEGGASGFDVITEDAATWGSASLVFPHVQGADVCGRIVAVGDGVDPARMGERIIIEGWLRDPDDPANREKAGYFGSECWGGYAQYTTAPAVNAYPVESDLSDPELATFPCSYATAEYMLSRAGLGDGETVLITGASGGVGSALVQLAKRRGATVVALAGAAKMVAVAEVGADYVLDRNISDLPTALIEAIGRDTVEVVADVVGGHGFPALIEALGRGGRYATSGAIAGPIVQLDLRTLYLHDLRLEGATVMPPAIFADLVGYIERGEIRPLLAATYPLAELRQAQAEFIEKRHVGNLVVIPE